jgi:hypothetical protein
MSVATLPATTREIQLVSRPVGRPGAGEFPARRVAAA